MNAVKLGLWPKVSSLVILLGVLNTGSLCSLGNLSLCLSGRGHEGDQSVADRLLRPPRDLAGRWPPSDPWRPLGTNRPWRPICPMGIGFAERPVVPAVPRPRGPMDRLAT